MTPSQFLNRPLGDVDFDIAVYMVDMADQAEQLEQQRLKSGRGGSPEPPAWNPG